MFTTIGTRKPADNPSVDAGLGVVRVKHRHVLLRRIRHSSPTARASARGSSPGSTTSTRRGGYLRAELGHPRAGCADPDRGAARIATAQLREHEKRRLVDRREWATVKAAPRPAHSRHLSDATPVRVLLNEDGFLAAVGAGLLAARSSVLVRRGVTVLAYPFVAVVATLIGFRVGHRLDARSSSVCSCSPAGSAWRPEATPGWLGSHSWCPARCARHRRARRVGILAAYDHRGSNGVARPLVVVFADQSPVSPPCLRGRQSALRVCPTPNMPERCWALLAAGCSGSTLRCPRTGASAVTGLFVWTAVVGDRPGLERWCVHRARACWCLRRLPVGLRGGAPALFIARRWRWSRSRPRGRFPPVAPEQRPWRSPPWSRSCSSRPSPCWPAAGGRDSAPRDAAVGLLDPADRPRRREAVTSAGRARREALVHDGVECLLDRVGQRRR